MPTGYTYPIQNNEKISFKQFALNCAKAFGACITLRDSGDPIPMKFKPNTRYYTENIQRLKQELKQLKKKKDSQLLLAWEENQEKNYQKKCELYDEAINFTVRYNDMLDQVNFWIPPTKDHEELKKFMVEQLQSSLKFDCNPAEHYPVKTKEIFDAKKYRQEHLEYIEKDILYYQKKRTEEIQNVKERNVWIEALRKSLPKK